MARSSDQSIDQTLKNSGFLLMAGMIAKLLSAVYKVPIQNWTGDKGFYVYQQVYPLYALLIAFSLNTFPLIIAKILAEQRPHHQKSESVIEQLILWLAIFGMLSALLLYGGAENIARWMGDIQLSAAIKSLSSACLVLPFVALIRGYFQSQNNTFPTSMSQIVEQIVRVSILLLVAYSYQQTAIYQMGASAYLAVVISALAALLCLLIFLKKDRAQRPVKKLNLAKPNCRFGWQLAGQSVMLTAVNSLMILMQLIDSSTVLKLLTKNQMASTKATILKGIYDRGQPLAQIALVLSSALAAAMLPVLRQSHVSLNFKQWQRHRDVFIYLTSFLSFSAAVGLAGIMPYLNQALFGDQAETLTLSVYVLSVIWMSLIQMIYLLHLSRGRGRVALVSVVSGIVLKWTANQLLVPHLQVLGASLATNIALIGALLSLILVSDSGLGEVWREKYYILKLCLLMPLLFIVSRYLPKLLLDNWVVNQRLLSLGQATLGVVFGVALMMSGGLLLGLIHKEWFLMIKKQKEEDI